MGRKRRGDWYFSFDQKSVDKRRHLWQKRVRAIQNADYEEAMELQEELGYKRKDGSDIYPGDHLVQAIWEGKVR